MLARVPHALQVLAGARPAVVRFDADEAVLRSQIAADVALERLYPALWDVHAGAFVRTIDERCEGYVRSVVQREVFEAISAYAGRRDDPPAPPPTGENEEIPF